MQQFLFTNSSEAEKDMKTIRDIEELKGLIAENRQRIGKIRKNNIQMLNAMADKTDAGRIQVSVHDDGLLLYTDEDTYCTICYYWREDALLPDISAPKPAVIEISGRTGRNDDETESFLRKSGYALHRVNLQVERTLSDSAEKPFLNAGLVLLNSDTENYFQQAVRMWEENLDCFDIPAEHRSLHDDDHLICVLDASGQIAGVHWWRNSGRYSEGRHTVTDPEHQRMGIASAMIRQWLSDAKTAGAEKAGTWICTENFRSLNLYKKLGFEPNGRYVKQFVKEDACNG